jgi:hypothetical protein
MTLDWYAGLENSPEVQGDGEASIADTGSGIWETLQKRIQIAEYQPERNPDVI